jgi:hypothetical protein
MPYGARIQTNQIENDGCLKYFGILEIAIAKLGTHGAINSLLLQHVTEIFAGVESTLRRS